MGKIKEKDWITTELLDGPAYVVATLHGIVKVKYRGRFYFFTESEVKRHV